ncbi:MAG: formate dehydrogenase accessory sulfurtransferase FdhD [Sphingomicrobium sp.]
MAIKFDSFDVVATKRVSLNAVIDGERRVPIEAPIAISFLGIGYAVMMATPSDLEDFAVGFARSERLIESMSDIERVSVEQTDGGVLLNLELAPDRHEGLFRRVRHRVGESSCGMCRIANLDQAIKPLPRLAAPPRIKRRALFDAVAAIAAHQPLNEATGAVHAAALVSPGGTLIAVREDVGRHNAFDKLVGHCLREAIDPGAGFVLLTSRCSYELVEKAALAGVSLLVTVSAPTSLAIERSREAGLTLIALARGDEMLLLVDPHDLFG